MKTIISKLAIASILSISLITVLTISSHLHNHKTAALLTSDPVAEMLSGSGNNLLNTLNGISWR
jgi:hypothetical protein